MREVFRSTVTTVEYTGHPEEWKRVADGCDPTTHRHIWSRLSMGRSDPLSITFNNVRHDLDRLELAIACTPAPAGATGDDK